jgi:hypothetical protein
LAGGEHAREITILSRYVLWAALVKTLCLGFGPPLPAGGGGLSEKSQRMGRNLVSAEYQSTGLGLPLGGAAARPVAPLAIARATTARFNAPLENCMAKTMKHPILLAALICLAAKPTHAQPSEYGDMTDAEVKAIQMTSLAMLAGSHGNCPKFHVVATALSEEWYEAHIFVDRPKFKNAMTFSTLGPLEQMRKDPVEFCRGAWELLGSNGLYRRQLLEAN